MGSNPGSPAAAKIRPDAGDQADRRWRLVIGGAILLATAVLLFARLGHCALWDDEAGTALTAKGILRTGDTSALVDDHNIFAYRTGFELRDLKLRYLPPLQAYLTAASFALLSEQNSFSARLPFALFGLATAGLLMWWLVRVRASRAAVLLMALALLGNVSLLLYARQCRYYAPTVFFSVAIVYLYLHRTGGRRDLLLMAAASLLLFASNYLNYAALYFCLAVDYLLWERRVRSLRPADWAVLLGPQIVLCGAIAYVWNPLSNVFGGSVGSSTLMQKAVLWGTQWRDLNRCEFLCGVLVLAGGIAAWRTRDRWLMRGLLALFAYVTLVTLVSPQPVLRGAEADIRYLVPVIPLGMALATRTILVLTGRRLWLALAVAAVAFGTNFLHGGPWLSWGLRSTLASYLGELAHPPGDPFTPVAEWIERHAPDRASVWVLPDYATYPLMFHAPKAVYAWQITPPPAGQFRDLPPIHFKGKVPPDFIVAFGPVVQKLATAMDEWQPAGVRYERVATVDFYWDDRYRPELFWHAFTPITGYDKNSAAIFIFKLVAAPNKNSPDLPAGAAPNARVSASPPAVGAPGDAATPTT